MREPGSRGCPQDRVADVGPGPEREARRDQRGEAREGAGRKGHCDDGKSPSRERGEDEHGGPQPERVGEESPDGVEPPRNAGEEPLERALERPLWIRRDHGADAEQRGHEQNNVRPATRPRLPLGGGEEPQPLTQQLRGDDAAGGARPIGELDAVAHRRSYEPPRSGKELAFAPRRAQRAASTTALTTITRLVSQRLKRIVAARPSAP